MRDFDYVHFKSGDGGGDESEASAPYGKTLIYLCEDYARILHKYHPHSKIFVGNQKLDNAGDRAMFQYLQEKPRDWIDGLVYGPGSNAMGWMPGRRQDHRMDLFQDGGQGGLSGYLREMLHQLPPRQSILLFTDLTHWVYSQYGLMDHALIPDRDHHLPPKWDSWMYERKPSAELAQVYNRRTFHARPRNYYRVFQETAEFAIGDVAYSEGHHDHLNQWMYQRLFWHPFATVEDVVTEYARTFFGPEAAPEMAEAIFRLEHNLETPLRNNPGIGRLIELVELAGAKMPADGRAKNSLWREYLQKADLDRYIQLDVNRQNEHVDAILAKLKTGFDGSDVDGVLSRLADVELPAPSPEMIRLKSAADRLGQESDRLAGVRSEGYFNLKQDYVGFGWLKREIDRARAAASADERRAIIERIVYYEDPGEGGFYDNAGVPEKAPHLVYGWPYGDGIISHDNRPSQRKMAFTTDEARGVTFQYEQLDPQAQYRVRLSLVRPRYARRYAGRQHQTGESIYADNLPLAENLEPPEYRRRLLRVRYSESRDERRQIDVMAEKAAGHRRGAEIGRDDLAQHRGLGNARLGSVADEKGGAFPSRSHAPACAKGETDRASQSPLEDRRSEAGGSSERRGRALLSQPLKAVSTRWISSTVVTWPKTFFLAEPSSVCIPFDLAMSSTWVCVFPLRTASRTSSSRVRISKTPVRPMYPVWKQWSQPVPRSSSTLFASSGGTPRNSAVAASG